MNISYVILHYKTLDDTIECIESIRKTQTNSKADIVVVDNASNNGSYESLQNRYADDNSVHFIHNHENLGFAKGNNVGFEYAKYLGSDYIAILNNDIIISTNNIIDIVENCFENYHFSIMGPDIISLVDKGHQNPTTTTTTDLRTIKNMINKYRLLRILNRLSIYDIFKRLFGEGNERKKIQQKCANYKINVQIHGAFIIYSPLYIKNEVYAFCPDTFLYTEEPILFQYCVRKGYKTLYCPDITVYHKEDSSTNAVYDANYSKREFVFKNLIKSYKVYYKHVKENVENWSEIKPANYDKKRYFG